MAINYGKIKYFKTCANIKDLPDEKLPEIVLAGRSNVGKSSLVNALGNNSKLARVSQTPGKTQQIIYFDMDGQAILADLPGYGYIRETGRIPHGRDLQDKAFFIGCQGKHGDVGSIRHHVAVEIILVSVQIIDV